MNMLCCALCQVVLCVLRYIECATHPAQRNARVRPTRVLELARRREDANALIVDIEEVRLQPEVM